MDHHKELMEAAARLWIAVDQLDAMHGGEGAWRWAHREIARLTREGCQEDPEAVRELARVAERRIASDRGEVEA